MPVTSKLKNQVDLPVWEWLRPAVNSTANANCTTMDPTSGSRYVYYINSGGGTVTNFNRYDTYSDAWQSLANLPNAFSAGVGFTTYSKWHGHYGRVISAGTGSNTLEIAALQGNALIGYKIRIIAGRGAGQERTITAVSDPIVKDRGIVVTTSTSQIIADNAGIGIKQWKVNQWRDYQVRVLYGTTAGALVRPILYNNYNTITFYDASWASITPWWGPLSPTTTSNNTTTTIFQIESNIVTVDSNWTTAPDSTSQFEILSDGIWFLNTLNSQAAPYHSISYYDIISDTWYYKTATHNLFSGFVTTDLAGEKFLEYPVYNTINNATSATPRTLIDTTLSLSANQFTNYAVGILSGTGIGQYRSIVATASSTFFVNKVWDVTPDSTSQYGIYRDVNKFYWTGFGNASIFQYDVNSDQSLTGKLYDNGIARTCSVSGAGFEPLAVTSITRATGAATTIAVATSGTGYQVDTIISFTGGASVRVTGVNSAGGITSISIENFGSGYAGGGAAMTISSTVPALAAGSTAATFTNTIASTVGNVVTVAPHPYKMNDSVVILGDTASAPNFNNTYSIISNNAVTGFGFITSAAQNATVPAQGTTSLVDVTKNWATNELVGKLIQITSGASPSPTVQTRKITSNTSNTINWGLAITAATNGTSRYAIFDEKSFATDQSYNTILAGGRSGVATSGATSTLTDTTKNWPINYWSDIRPSGGGNTSRKVKIIAGTGAGTEVAILSCSTNTLYLSSLPAVTPDNTTVYQVMENFGQATSGSLTTLVDTTQNWATNAYVGKRVRITAGNGLLYEASITTNTQTQLTFGAIGVAVDSSSSYSIIEPTTRGQGSGMIVPRGSTNSTINNRYIYMFRSNATAELGRYNITSEQFDTLTYFPLTETLTTGTYYAYDGVDRIYIQKDTTGRISYYDLAKNIFTTSSSIPYGMGNVATGNRMEVVTTVDNLKYLYVSRHSGQEWWRCLLFW